MNESILKLLKNRYFLPSESKWEDLAIRVGHIYEPITNDIINMNFVPSTPTLMNYTLNNERKGTLSSCFPMGIEDSIDGIFDSVKECAIVTKMGGGVGIDFSVLRGSNEIIKTLNANSSGPLVFIEVFNSTLDSIRQGGKRRGAGMGLLSVEHPDILDFIDLKKNLNKINRLNISIKIPSYFYELLEKNPNIIHKIKYKDGTYHELIDKNGNKVTVKELWDKIIHMAWLCAEPGIFNETIAFDRCTITNIDKTVICNPCSEYTSIPYTSCNLGSLNVSNLVDGKKFNWDKLEELVIKATRYLNNVIDKNDFPIDKIKEVTLKTRPIGLGVMGLAHALIKKEIPYNSQKAVKFTEELFRYITLRSMQESIELAKKDGSYEAFDHDLFIKANERFFKHSNCRNINIESLLKDLKKYGVRNNCFTSIAPTGSISTISNTSGGIEPLFALSYMRKVEKLNKEYDIMYISDPLFEKYLNENFDINKKEKILKQVTDNYGSCQKCEDIPKEIRDIFKVAGDLTPMEHLDILEAVAVNISLSVSKTINMPTDITEDKISEVFLEAHKRGIIGVTCYRDGCREGILVHNKEEDNSRNDIIQEHHAPKRPERLPCDVHRVMYQGKKWIVFVSLLYDKPFEIFAGAVEDVNIPKNITNGIIRKQKSRHYSFEYDDEILINDINKSFNCKEQDAFSRLVSLALRHGVPIVYISETLNKAQGDITSFAKVIARTLKKHINNGERAGVCPECNSKLIYYEGCIKCSQCMYNKCD